MKHLIVSVAGLGWSEMERRKCREIYGLKFNPVQSPFPAVTCVAQASLRTASEPSNHGMTSNGYFSQAYLKPSFWEQSANLVLGERIWDEPHARGETVGMYFFQQSLGEDVDFLISPAPIHKHEGGMIMACYTKPDTMAAGLEKSCGTFPLWRYWGPLASPAVGDACMKRFFAAANKYDPDIAFLYLPTLDYEAQRFGPDDPRSAKAWKVFDRELRKLSAFAEKQGATLSVVGEYGIEEVTAPPVFPNRILREAGLFKVRQIRGMAYPDFYESKAFAMVDHQVAHVYVRDPSDVEYVRATLERTGLFNRIESKEGGGSWAHPSAGDLLLVSKKGSWCAYPWWTDRREAPDYATHIDIHNKPGYDPCELFFDKKFPIPPSTCQDSTRIKGSHGRPCNVAVATTAGNFTGDTFISFAEFVRDAIK